MKTTLGELIQHDELFKRYLRLKDTKVELSRNLDYDTLGMVDSDGSLTLNFNRLEGITDTLLHEVQHIIQRKHGYARGGNPEQFIKTPQEVEELGRNITMLRNTIRGVMRKA